MKTPNALCEYANGGKRITAPGKFEGHPVFAPHPTPLTDNLEEFGPLCAGEALETALQHARILEQRNAQLLADTVRLKTALDSTARELEHWNFQLATTRKGYERSSSWERTCNTIRFARETLTATTCAP